ncbi:hypothetical protein SeMB42_g07673 [Synchytrium endobioticum]|uniref:NAD(P)-binding domain-containing protein n=1 Tax=Synchytrium endobioticum TaxID=286115 RepID=A0A507CSW3_9FUNG|nr:hypothetical protein SeMB42_g07673 [Synchytrium endobioticum]TPX42262.1 hypothetical protein SeLEV6574_g05692 [Synchytrium endobioticum]
MAPKVVLVTGVAGFIGFHLARALLLLPPSEVCLVIGIDELNDYYDIRLKASNLKELHHFGADRFVFHRFDISDGDRVREIFEQCGRSGHPISHVAHLAARAGVRPSIQSPELYVQSNINGTISVLEASRRYNVTNFVYASSSSVYGDSKKVPFSESDRTDRPVSPYAATKKACELLASTYSHLYGLPTTGLRFFTVYGPRGRPDMAPFMFVDRVANGIPIHKFGDGTSSRDYTYIDDITSGILSAINLPRQNEIYNLGNEKTVTLNEFISVVENLVGRAAIINQCPDQPGDVGITYADLSKSEKDLGYRPTHTFAQGMEKFVKWYVMWCIDILVLDIPLKFLYQHYEYPRYHEYRQEVTDDYRKMTLPPALQDCEDMAPESSGVDSSEASVVSDDINESSIVVEPI